MDKIRNFYEEVPKEKKAPDPYFKNHLIEPNARIGLIGGSGSGKTQWLLNFLERVGPRFYEIYIYTTDVEEDLLKILKQKLTNIFITNDINAMPSVEDFPSAEKKKEKLVVFDDFITLSNRDQVKLEEYAISGRKYGITTLYMVQNYTQLGKNISRNLNYIVLFKLTDTVTIRNILANHNIHGITKEKLNKFYQYATTQKFNFLLLDLNPDKKQVAFRHNFLNILV